MRVFGIGGGRYVVFSLRRLDFWVACLHVGKTVFCHAREVFMIDDEMIHDVPPSDEAPAAQPADAEAPLIDTREAEIEALTAQVAELKNAVLRERADQENLRKRFEREKESALKFGSEKLVRDLLPVLDSLTLGLDAAKAHEAEGKQALDQFIAGSAMTLKLLLEVLEKNGITEINPVGEKLDPEQHQALSAIPSPDAEPNTILHVAQKGYLLNGRVIRAAQVIVADGAQKNPPQS
jgi:grpE